MGQAHEGLAAAWLGTLPGREIDSRVLNTRCCSIIRFFRFSPRFLTVSHGDHTGIFRNALAEGHIHRIDGAEGAAGDRRPRFGFAIESFG